MPDVFDDIGRYYDALVRRHGHSPEACDYGRRESQRIKFEILAQAAPLAGKSLLDVGCGFADFADFLAEVNPPASYTGWDISPAMVREAARLHQELEISRTNILTEPVGRRFDVVVANGIFYLLGEKAGELMQQFIVKMLATANEVVAFNSLSSWAIDQEPGEFYADPVATLEFCRTLTPRVALRHDYHSRDFTIYLRKV